MWLALREHIPRSSVWKNLDRWETLREEIRTMNNELRKPIEALVETKSEVGFSASPEEAGLSSGVIDALAFHFSVTARGEAGLAQRADFRLTSMDRETTGIEYGAYNIGRLSNDRVDNIKNLVTALLSEVITWEEHTAMEHLFTQLEHVRRNLHEELLIIILKRIVPGRCKYCPI